MDAPVSTLGAPTSNPMPNRDERIEQWIESHGATWEFKNIPISSIDKERSHRNQARFEALREETFIVYRDAMERGDQFPPIIVFKSGDDYVVIDGNHRVAGAELAGATEIGAYIVSGLGERQLQTMTFEANTKHGLPSSIEERTKHGVYLVDVGVTQRDAARLVNVPLHTLQYELTKARSERRLAALGVDRWSNIGASTRARLDNIRSNVVFKAAAEVIVAGKMNNIVAGQLVTDVNKQSDETAQLAVVEEARKKHETIIRSTAGGRLPMPTSLVRLTRSLAYAEALIPDELRNTAATLTAEQREAFASRAEKSIESLRTAKEILSGGA